MYPNLYQKTTNPYAKSSENNNKTPDHSIKISKNYKKIPENATKSLLFLTKTSENRNAPGNPIKKSTRISPMFAET